MGENAFILAGAEEHLPLSFIMRPTLNSGAPDCPGEEGAEGEEEPAGIRHVRQDQGGCSG